MADERVLIEIEAEDNASSKIDKVSSSIQNLGTSTNNLGRGTGVSYRVGRLDCINLIVRCDSTMLQCLVLITSLRGC